MSLRNMMLASAGGAGAPGFTGGPYQVFDHTPFPPGGAQAGCEIRADGSVHEFHSTGPGGEIGRWDGGGSLSKLDFEFRYDLDAGTPPNGFGSEAVNVWIAASASATQWNNDTIGFGFRFSRGDLRIRLAAAPFTEYTDTRLDLEADTS